MVPWKPPWVLPSSPRGAQWLPPLIKIYSYNQLMGLLWRLLRFFPPHPAQLIQATKMWFPGRMDESFIFDNACQEITKNRCRDNAVRAVLRELQRVLLASGKERNNTTTTAGRRCISRPQITDESCRELASSSSSSIDGEGNAHQPHRCHPQFSSARHMQILPS